MIEKYLIEHCSPTLANLKTANLFSFKVGDIKTLKESIRAWNYELNEKGIYLSLLNVKNNLALVYVYRRKKLEEDLKKDGVGEILNIYGYKNTNVDYAINTLKERLKFSDNFPHEIGLFLGYPLEDVKGFIENLGKNSKCSGCWKVYSNECEKIKMFNKFNKCKKVYSMLFNGGRSISKLAVGI